MKNIVRGKKKIAKNVTLCACYCSGIDDIYTGYINEEMHNSLYKIEKRNKRR
jgi:hypothetical protein